MKSHYRGHKMAVWLNLIPQLHRPGEPEVSMRHHHFHEREPHYYSGKYSDQYIWNDKTDHRCNGPVTIIRFPLEHIILPALVNHNYPFVIGNVRAESFTRPKQFQNGIINGVQESRQHQETYVNFDCTPDPTLGEALSETEEPSTTDSETDDLLQQFASKHYYRYAREQICYINIWRFNQRKLLNAYNFIGYQILIRLCLCTLPWQIVELSYQLNQLLSMYASVQYSIYQILQCICCNPFIRMNYDWIVNIAVNKLSNDRQTIVRSELWLIQCVNA